MESVKGVGETVAGAAAAVVERLAAYLPSALGAALLLVAGWLVARLLRALTVRAVLVLDTLLNRIAGRAGAERVRVGRATGIAGTVVFWVTLLFFVTAATQVLGLTMFTEWLARLIDYLPTLAAGLLIVVAGYLLARFTADMVHATATRLPAHQRAMLARITQAAILVGAILVGADQIGVRITFLAIFVAAAAAAVVGAAALAIGLGARGYVANLIGAHHLRHAFAVGQVIRVGGLEGRILEVNATAVVIETEDGRVSLPGRVYDDGPIAVLTRQAGAGRGEPAGPGTHGTA